MEPTWKHTTVLLNEAVEALVTKPDATYVDATFGPVTFTEPDLG